MESRVHRMPNWLGPAVLMAIIVFVAVATLMITRTLFQVGVIVSRGVVIELSDTVVEKFDERSEGVDPLVVAYIRAQVKHCAMGDARTHKLDYTPLVGWHGFGAIGNDKWDEAAQGLLRGCVKDVVLGSASVQDARDRNALLGNMGLSPFPDKALTTMSFGATAEDTL